MNVSVRLFARAREIVGAETIAVELPEGANIGQLRQRLLARSPALEGLSSHLLVAVGTEYVTDEATIPEGAEVAVFPPVSGG